MVHFSKLLSGHLALVARNDPLIVPHNIDEHIKSTPILLEFEQPKGKAGLLVTAELESAIDRVTKNVAAISKACRARNSKFR
jgi:hypothetical protein